ncbi:hypothetical protein H8N03_22405 [Ramlibacter sp. USB13]|uniref:Uncharacterized protein n=1 Tax=Ramlibacter cellulosilyticus TaxID=2764187 RepID=A0A923SD77_9BURK|nr:hypothetical protein [Ramlibacter cellulosilyticus]MBC5785710.1 hypothetical protein [Ramlibacter cellulosilyticus]
MNQRGEERFKTVLQVIAILLLAGMVGMILHKGYADVSALTRENGSGDFWPALLRYVFRNLAGG